MLNIKLEIKCLMYFVIDEPEKYILTIGSSVTGNLYYSLNANIWDI